MNPTRRDFLKHSASFTTAAATCITMPRPLFGSIGSTQKPVPPIRDSRTKELIQRGLDAARTAGASYADIRMTHKKMREYKEVGRRIESSDDESMTLGVRVLANGYWGFASGSIWSVDEIVRLANFATSLATTNALGKPRQVALAPVPVVHDGHWVMPVKIDPFEVSRAEIQDYIMGLGQYSRRYTDWILKINKCVFAVLDKAFGSTDGTYWTQRTFESGGSMAWDLTNKATQRTLDGGLDDYLSVAGRGWELYFDQPLREGIRQLHEELVEDSSFPVKPVDVGRYDAVLNARSIVELLNGSIGAATQLDRALGYEANAGGTSYVNDPRVMLGTFTMGSPLLHVTANRNSAGGVTTVKWDDESVEPDEFTLVTSGVLSDFQTTRESAGWMHDWTDDKKSTVRSHGCASAPQGLDTPLTHIPNLVMTPGSESQDFSTLSSSIKKGVAVKNARIRLDFQQLNGFGRGSVYEIKNGKRTAVLANAGILLMAPEFWKSIVAIGSTNSVVRYGTGAIKGEPPQARNNSVDVVPVAVKDLTIIDVLRKA